MQSIGITTTFNLQEVFEVGQIAIYEQIEQIPDVEVTMEKVIDGYPLLYHLATNGATSGTLTGRSTMKAIVGLSVFSDTLDSASGTPLAELQMSGMFVSNVSYTFPVEGNCTEAITLVGNNKVWTDVENGGSGHFSGAFLDNNDQPAAAAGNPNGVQQRQDVLFAPISGSPTGVDTLTGATNAYMTVLPTDIDGITGSGTNPSNADGTHAVSVQSIQVSADLGRDAIYELGRKSPYTRYVTFPIEVRTEIEVLSKKFDNISATEEGGQNGAPAGSNLKNQTIRVQLREGTRIDLGNRNKLQSLTYGGGDAGSGGGNVSLRYSYRTFNTLTVTSPHDPNASTVVSV